MEAIELILDDKNPQSVLLVEIETGGGHSVNIGTRREDAQTGLTVLRITREDIEKINLKCVSCNWIGNECELEAPDRNSEPGCPKCYSDNLEDVL